MKKIHKNEKIKEIGYYTKGINFLSFFFKKKTIFLFCYNSKWEKEMIAIKKTVIKNQGKQIKV